MQNGSGFGDLLCQLHFNRLPYNMTTAYGLCAAASYGLHWTIVMVGFPIPSVVLKIADKGLKRFLHYGNFEFCGL